MSVCLSEFDNRNFSRGRSALVQGLWLIVQALLVSSWLPGSAHRRALLRLFGAKIGTTVRIKPRVRVKFPWRLVVGEHSWIGEGVWIDNLAETRIGSNCCISQEAYLCTGSHDSRARAFDLVMGPIVVNDGAWIAAKAAVGPGVTVGEGAILTLGSVATRDLDAWTIYRGVPAVRVGTRSLGKI